MTDERTVTVTFQPAGIRVVVPHGSTIFEASQIGHLRMRSVCGGKGTCGKCKVILEAGQGDANTELIAKHLSVTELSHGYTLACQTRIRSDLEVFIPLESRVEGQKILTWASYGETRVDPLARALYLAAEATSERQSISPDELLGRLRTASGSSLTLSEGIRAKAEALLGRGAKGLTFTVTSSGDGPEIIDVTEGDTSASPLGLALDVGTTKLVMYVVNLKTGEVLDVESDYNDQILYGEDLLTRIEYARIRPEGTETLRKAVVTSTNRLITKLLARNRLDPERVIDMTLAGNTVMNHLAVGLNPSYLSETNMPVSRKPVVSKAGQLGLAINPGAYVYCLPNVSRYVGGDAIGDLLASGLCDANDIGVLIDMGTNGEILLGSKGWAFSCSCASGPAFEGWEIRHGMRAVTGAVEHVTINPDTLRASYTVIGGPEVKPKGICGSGLIDATAQMLLTGILDRWGNLRPQAHSQLVRQGSEGFEYLLVPAEESALDWDIVVTQRDIRNLLESKAAVCAGVAVLMKKVGATIMDVKSLYLAGAFGNYLDPRNAAIVGIFPEFPRAAVHRIGNGSVAGAYLALVSREQRRRAAALAQTTTYFDLSADPDFAEEYDAALALPGRKDLFPSTYSLISRPSRGRSKEETEDLLSLLLGRT